MVKKPVSNKNRLKRHERVRKNVSGTPERPRLNVFRSLKHIYAQVIDDVNGVTLASASTLDKEFAVVYDRGGYLYHGRVLELAEGAREGGLEF